MCGSEVWGLIKAGKELDNVHNRLFSKLMDIQNCVANGFAEIELGRQSRKSKCIAQVVQYWYLVVWTLAIQQNIIMNKLCANFDYVELRH